ncbi:MAG: DUF3846 domain-containing protein [Ruminococcus sp.]|nr:DUF3846 domain-containing protein [Ruminococcus sp.]
MGMSKEAKLKIVVVEPLKKPYVKEIENTLDSQREVVGGNMEMLPFDVPDAPLGICIICNENGKLENLPYNRAYYYDEYGKPSDILSGTFFVCSVNGEDFASLSEEQEKAVLKRFEYVEQFIEDKDCPALLTMRRFKLD